ncbi:MAG: division/cell wall cluster transcriptional repressor MraZ [Armatimonadota bacterium]
MIPSKFRSKLGERFYLTKGMHGCLWIFADDAWREFQSMLTPRSALDSRGLKLERFFVGSAVECTPDGQGRVAIPQNLREHAGLEDDIWVIGLGGKVEIWSAARWEEFNNDLTDDVIEELGAELLLSSQLSAAGSQ